MADSTPSQAQARPPVRAVDALREGLDRLENLVGIIPRREAAELREIPALLDQVRDLFAQLQASGGQWSAEEARLRTIHAQLDRQAGVVVKKLGGGAAFAAERARLPEPPDAEARWWWYLDERVAARRRALLKKIAIGVGVAAVLLIAAVVIYQRFFAPDPATLARYEHESNAEALAMEGDLEGALAEIELGLAYDAADPTLLGLKVAILDTQGDSDAAEEARAALMAAVEQDQEKSAVALGQAYLRLGNPNRAVEELNNLLAVMPDSAYAYYLLGTSQEALGDSFSAVQDYLRAADLAAQAGDNQLEAMARMAMAYANQRMMLPDMGTPTPTPE
jgi:tetratricopeptide (TPR) repeat protein